MKSGSVVLLVGLRVPPEIADKFETWYTQDFPMLKFPGIKAAWRCRIAKSSDEFPNYLGIYEFESQKALEEYQTSQQHAEQGKFVTETRPIEVKWEYPSKWRSAYTILRGWKK